jgi:hypothetical protein
MSVTFSISDYCLTTDETRETLAVGEATQTHICEVLSPNM